MRARGSVSTGTFDRCGVISRPPPTLPLQSQQLSPDKEHVGERGGDLQPVQVLRQPPVADLWKPKTRFTTPIECSTLARTRDFSRFFALIVSSIQPPCRWRRLVQSCAAGAQRRITSVCPW